MTSRASSNHRERHLDPKPNRPEPGDPQQAATEILARLRSALDRIETAVEDHSCRRPGFDQQTHDFENLHEEAMNALRSLVPCERKTFGRRQTAQAVLSGLHFH